MIENILMWSVWIVMGLALLMPFFVSFYTALRGKPTYPTYPNASSSSDNEYKQVALMKDQVDILDKNRRESWTSPTYFKK